LRRRPREAIGDAGSRDRRICYFRPFARGSRRASSMSCQLPPLGCRPRPFLPRLSSHRELGAASASVGRSAQRQRATHAAKSSAVTSVTSTQKSATVTAPLPATGVNAPPRSPIVRRGQRPAGRRGHGAEAEAATDPTSVASGGTARRAASPASLAGARAVALTAVASAPSRRAPAGTLPLLQAARTARHANRRGRMGHRRPLGTGVA
jgi:hypothetical protein